MHVPYTAPKAMSLEINHIFVLNSFFFISNSNFGIFFLQVFQCESLKGLALFQCHWWLNV